MKRPLPSGFQMARVYDGIPVYGSFTEDSYTVVCDDLNIRRTCLHSSTSGISTTLNEIIHRLGGSPKTQTSSLVWFGLSDENLWMALKPMWASLGAVFPERVLRGRGPSSDAKQAPAALESWQRATQQERVSELERRLTDFARDNADLCGQLSVRVYCPGEKFGLVPDSADPSGYRKIDTEIPEDVLCGDAMDSEEEMITFAMATPGLSRTQFESIMRILPVWRQRSRKDVVGNTTEAAS